MHAFKIVTPRGCRLPLVAHLPHASTVIPPDIRETIKLDDAGLAREIIRLTDWHTDDLFSWVIDLGGSMFVNCLSRLVFDPERFVDDAQEPMAKKGQGVVYTLTADGAVLRNPDPVERQRLIEAYYNPYHEALTDLVEPMLSETGTALILDCHSFRSKPLAVDSDQCPHRPDICIGTDCCHTPQALADSLQDAFENEGLTVRRNSPFAESLVPMKYYGTDQRVASVMIEIRRDLYCNESTGEKAESYTILRQAVERAVRRGVAQMLPGIGAT